MTAYIIKITACALLLYALYVILLERENMHRFKRIYLLFSLVFSIAVPFVTMTVNAPQVSANVAIFYNGFEKVVETAIHQPLNIETSVKVVKTPNYKMLALFVYLFVTTLLLFRLLRNCWLMLAFGRKNYITDYKGAKISLIRKKLLPHSFGRYIFINKDDYENGLIVNEILVHEWAHVCQRHTWDVVFIELLIAVGWFNPIFYMYRSKIRQNHEFLADQAVIGNNRDCIPAYQTILINNIPQIKKVSFTSNFYYLITKQRIVMMTKTKTKKGALCRSFALIPVFTVAICVFSTKIIAQNDLNTLTEIIEVSVENPVTNNDRIENVSEKLLTEYQEIVAQNDVNTLTEIIEISVENVREIIPEQTNVCVEGLNTLTRGRRINVAGDEVTFLASYSTVSDESEDFVTLRKYVAFRAGNRYRFTICTDEKSAGAAAILQLFKEDYPIRSSINPETGAMSQYFDYDCLKTGAYMLVVNMENGGREMSAVANVYHVGAL